MAVRVIKKYPNRRLYDTEISSYITVEDVRQLIVDGEDFEVRDAKTAEDITRSILLQIILEEESGGVPMFSTQTLAQMLLTRGRLRALPGIARALRELHRQKMFSHRVGRLEDTSGEAGVKAGSDAPQSNAAATAAAGVPLAAAFFQPKDIRQAIIVSEVLQRPEHRW